MKYVLLQVKQGGENLLKVPLMFPDMLVHSMVVDQMTAMLKMQYFKHDKPTTVEVISAGEWSSTIWHHADGESVCNGESTTLGVKSREHIDDAIIGSADYGSLMS